MGTYALKFWSIEKNNIRGINMSYEEYCARAVIRYLNGDMKLFYSYVHKAMRIYEQEKYIATIEELIGSETKNRLYELVS